MSSYTTTATNTYSGNNVVTLVSIANMVSGLPIVFTGNVFGNITANATYYIGNITSSNQITITSLPGGAIYQLANGTGTMTATFSSAGQYVIDIVPPGDPLDVAFNKTNLNFDQVFAAGPVGSNIQIANNTIRTLNTNGNLVLAPNGIGNVISNVNILPNAANIRNLGSPTRRWATIYAQYIDYQGGNISVNNISVSGNIQAGGYISAVGAIDSGGNISAAGNVTGHYILGNGSQLTGISVSTDKIFNGNSYANIPVANGNLYIGIDGYLWTYDTTGNLTLPGNTNSILYANGTPFTGAQGTTGTQGTTGAQGTDGTQGTTGAQGTGGSQGTTGIQGTQGVQGATGTQGVQGTDGAQGVQGVTGAQGTQGVQGTDGIQGVQGTDGAQGIQGVVGAQGTTGTQGTDGAQGIQGIQGVQGTDGVQGVQGVQGTNGTSVVIIGSVPTVGVDPQATLNAAFPSAVAGDGVIATDTGNLWVYDGALWNNVGRVQGPQGPTGPQGTVGAQGTTGTQGTTGIQGTQGVDGAQGVQGATGAQGTQGVTGAQGVQGVQGTDGAQGVQGATGAQGTQGVTGAQGTQGVQGIQGITGYFDGNLTANLNGQGYSIGNVSSISVVGNVTASNFVGNAGTLNLQTASNILYVAKNGSDSNDGSINRPFLTIKAALAASTAGTAVHVAPGTYTEANPITIPINVSLMGDNLRSVIVIPQTPASDLFYMTSGCYVWGITIKNYTANGFSFNPATSGQNVFVSPYIQNLTSSTTTGTAVYIDGNSVSGISTKAMIVGFFTIINQGGKGIHIVNSGYSQLVNIYTIACDIGIQVESGGFCTLNGSDCSIGNYGLVADGKGPLQTSGTLVSQLNGAFVIDNLSNGNPHVNTVMTIAGDPNYYTIGTIINGTPSAGNSTVLVQEIYLGNATPGDTVSFYTRSSIIASAHTFEYVGAGTNPATALPQYGGIPIEANEVIATNGAVVTYTSTDQKGNFKVGSQFIVNQATATITGDAFYKSLFAQMTPYILALGDS